MMILKTILKSPLTARLVRVIKADDEASLP